MISAGATSCAPRAPIGPGPTEALPHRIRTDPGPPRPNGPDGCGMFRLSANAPGRQPFGTGAQAMNVLTTSEATPARMKPTIPFDGGAGVQHRQATSVRLEQHGEEGRQMPAAWRGRARR